MKNLIICLTACLFTGFSWGQESFVQTAEGNWLANGTVRFFSTSSKAKLDGTTNKISSTFEIQAAPRGGYFIKDDLAIGLELFIATSSTKFENFDGKINTSTLFAAPFVRYYVYDGFFGEGTVGIGTSTTNDEFLGEQKSNVFGWRLGAGYNLPLGQHISLEPTINYSWENQTPKDAGDFTASNIITSLFVGLGITAYL